MQKRTREKPGFLHGVDMSDPENFEAYKEERDDSWRDRVAQRKIEIRGHRERLARIERKERNGWLCRWQHCEEERFDADPQHTKGYVVPFCRRHFEQIVLTGYSLSIRPDLTPPPPQPQAYRPDRRGGFIYYLRVGDTIKIGYTSRLASRLAQYPPNSVFLLAHEGTRDDEKQIHATLLASRSHGKEWYKINTEVTDFIEQQLAKHGTLEDPRPKPKTGYIVGARNFTGSAIR